MDPNPVAVVAAPVKPKRGRKPNVPVETVKDTDSIAESKPAPVKRGRKPKVVYEANKVLSYASDEEHIIMKLNITNHDVDEVDENEPNPYNDTKDMYPYMQLTNIENVPNSSNNDVIPHVTGLTKCAKESGCKIGGLKVVELLKDFEEKNKNDEWPQTTQIHCYWCCSGFDNAPHGIPVKYIGERFFVFGCFCSLSCAAAYNYDSRESNAEIWERHNLINLLARKMKLDKVKAAPPRLSLDIFGGHLSIEEFRAYTNSNKLININFPPMRTMTQQIEEINEVDISNEFKYIPVDTDRINRYKDKINLKRIKPVNTFENTLDHAMNLKFGSSVASIATA